MNIRPWIITLILAALPSAVPGQTINVTSPAAGNSWCIGSTYAITWTKSGDMQATVAIRLRTAGSSEADPAALTICNGDPNDGSYSWTIPDSVTPGSYFIRVRTDDSTVIGDSGIFEIRSCTALPDLLIVDTWITPKHPHQGETVEFRARLRNAGQAATVTAHDVYVGVRGPEGFAPIDKLFRIKPLAVNEAHEVFFSYPCTHWGIVKATVKLDSKPEVAESNENNNERVYSHGVSPLPDLVACVKTDVHTDVGEKKKVWAVAVNRGPAESPPCRLRWYVEQNGVVYRDVPHLDPGQEQVFYRDVHFDTKGNKDMTVVVDPDSMVPELNEENNKVEGIAIVKLMVPLDFDAEPLRKVCSDGK